MKNHTASSYSIDFDAANNPVAVAISRWVVEDIAGRARVRERETRFKARSSFVKWLARHGVKADPRDLALFDAVKTPVTPARMKTKATLFGLGYSFPKRDCVAATTHDAAGPWRENGLSWNSSAKRLMCLDCGKLQ